MRETKNESHEMRASSNGYKWLLVLVILALIGCNSGDAEGKQGLSGMILFDGQPLKAGTISFAPEQGSGDPASAMFSDGNYSLEAKKGLAPGRYVVKIFANATQSSELSPEELMTGSQRNTNESETPQQTIPAEYNTKSTQVIEVTAHGPNEFDFDIKSK